MDPTGEVLSNIDLGAFGMTVGARVLLNIDLGELPDEPEGLFASAHLANVACGGHAGDDASMRHAVALCRAHGTRVGAHPSYPDRAGFGRRAMAMSAAELRESVAEQCARLVAIARSLGERVVSVKPHGALYQATRDGTVADAVVAGALEALAGAVMFVGPPAGALAASAARAGCVYAREAFADRATRPDGTLVPRDQPGAVVTDVTVCVARARSLAARRDVDTICVHGDTPGAASIARAVRAALDVTLGPRDPPDGDR
jgi:5-oxoprolinase (ATP-hydrolysing) subunit A